MNDWEKDILRDFRPVDRVLLHMMKVMELIDLAKMMTDEDICLLKMLVKEPGEEPNNE